MEKTKPLRLNTSSAYEAYPHFIFHSFHYKDSGANRDH
jgi:hypothetical protein